MLGPKDVVFMVPDIAGDKFKNTFKEDLGDVVKESEDGYTVTIPVKNDDGEYELVEVEYTEVDGTRTINIPGKGDISIIQDENGDYNFELTPEQIKNADNISCSVNSAGDSKCTIKPFVTMVGSKILTADELVLDYKEGENLNIVGGDAKNLKLTDKDSSTDFNKSVVDAGDTRIDFKFSKNGETTPAPSGLDKFLNPFSTAENILSAPKEFQDADFFQISLNTSKMVQTVTNPKDRSQSATRFEVKDGGGVASDITFRNGDQTNLNINARTEGGIRYIPDPFSSTSRIIETTAPISANLNMDTATNKASLTLVMSGKDANGDISELTVTETDTNGDTSKVTAFGNTGVNITQGLITDGKDKNGIPKVDSNSPIAFEIVSDKIIANNKDSKNNENQLTINGLQSSGLIDKENGSGNAQASANNIKYQSQANGVLKKEAELGDGVQLALLETDDQKKVSAQAGYAYYNNGVVKANLSNGIFIGAHENKNKENAEIVDGKKLKSNIIAVGSSGEIDDGKSVVKLDKGFVFQEQQFFDGSKKYLVAGSDASVGNKDYQVDLKDNYLLQTNLDQNNQIQGLYLQGANFTAKEKKTNDVFGLVESNTAINKNAGITSIAHTSSGLTYNSGNGDKKLSSNGLKITGVDTGEIKYGTISFDDTTYKKGDLGENKFNDNISITGLSAAFYIDESDPDNKYKNIMADLGNVNVIGGDYIIDIIAKDKDGVDSKFSLVYLEEGNNKSYKIYGKDGRLVHIKGESRGKDFPDIKLESLEYFESNEFKQIAGKKISGTLRTVDADDDKLQSFHFARIDGAQSINGDFKQLSFENATVSEFDYKTKTNSFLTADSGNMIETTTDGVVTKVGSVNGGAISQNSPGQNTSATFDNLSAAQVTGKDGSKNSSVSITNANAQILKENEKSSILGLNLNAVQADSISYGVLSFDKASTGSGLLKNGKYSENIQITGLNAAFYIDESDPSFKKRGGEVSFKSLVASNSDFNINITAKDKGGVEQKMTVFFMEEGSTKSYKIYAEDGSLIYISGSDNKGNIPEAVFKSIELFETDEFKQMAILELSGSLKTINADDNRLTNFSVARIDGYEDKKTNYKQYIATEFLLNNSDYKNQTSTSLGAGNSIYTEETVDNSTSKNISVQGGVVSHITKKKSTSGTFDQLIANETTDAAGKKSSTGQILNFSGEQYKKDKKLSIEGANIIAVKDGDVLYGTINADNASSLKGLKKDASFDQKITITGLSGVFHVDNSDPNSKNRSALVNIDKMEVLRSDYELNIIAKDKSGVDKAFSLFYLHDENGKTVKVFAEDGDLVYVSGKDVGKDKEKDFPDVVFQSLQYFKSKDFKHIVAEKLSGNLKTTNSDDDKLQSFSVAKIDAVQSTEQNYLDVVAHNGEIQEKNYKKGQDAKFNFETIKFTKNSTIDFEQLDGELTNGVIDFVEYKPNSKESSKEVNLKIGNMIATKITKNEGEVITMVKAKGIELLAVDYEEMKKISGKVGSLYYYDDKNITTIDLKNLGEIRLEDMSTGGIFSANAQRILRVVERDDNGEEIGSYLLINKAFLNYNDKSKGINADIRVGVLELMQDKLNGQNVILEVDISGKITLEKGPVGAEVNFAAKGADLTHSSSSFKNSDGSFTSGEFAINTQGAKGRIDKLELSAGPSFMKNLFDFKASGGQGGGRRLQVTYSYDKKTATRHYTAKFLEGDKVSLKVGPLKWKSEKTKDGAEIDGELTLKGQSMEVQMNEISELIGTQKVNDWLRVSPGGFITVRTGTIAGMAIEGAYKPGETNMGLGLDAKASSIGASIVSVKDNGDESSVGVLFTGSSEFNVKTNKGSFEIFGIKQDKEANLPGTINLFYKKMYQDGDALYAGASYDLTSLLIDKEHIDSKASYFDNNRKSGGAGVNFAYKNALSENSSITFGVGANEEEAFCQIKFTANGIEPIGDTIRGISNVLNGMPFSKPKFRRPAKKTITNAQKLEITKLNKEIDEIEKRYAAARLIQKFGQALNGSFPFTELTGDEFEALSKLEISYGAKEKDATLASAMKIEALYTDPKESYDKKLDWLVSQTTEHKESLDKHYKDKSTVNIYMEYLERFNRLRDLGYHARSIR